VSTKVKVAEVKIEERLSEKESFKLMGMSVGVFGIFALITLVAVYLGALPKGMVGALPVMMVIGAVLNELGNRTPIIKDYLGGGPIVIIFASAALVTYGVLPEYTKDIMVNFMKGEGFLSFYIAALITGSILGMNRKLLIKASVRYLPIILSGVVVSLLMVGTVGMLLGYGFSEAIMYIGIPIMGGGMGAGAVPLSQIFGDALAVDPKALMSKMVPALALGNAIAIVIGGMLNRIGKKHKVLTGDGKLMKDQTDIPVEEDQESAIDLAKLGQGILMATAFFALGKILGKFLPVHSYALMIISVATVKVLGIVPREYEQAAHQWFRFVMKNFTPALLVGIGVAYTDLNAVINSFSVIYVVLVFVTVAGSAIGSGIAGHFLGFYAIEAAITGGLCMANMGGTGDVAVLSASKRMELMPFAQISSRIGGAFMLILATSLLSMFF